MVENGCLGFFGSLNIDAQDNQDARLPQDPQSLEYKPLIIIDLIRIRSLKFPHCIPLIEKESTRQFRTLAGRSADPESEAIK